MGPRSLGGRAWLPGPRGPCCALALLKRLTTQERTSPALGEVSRRPTRTAAAAWELGEDRAVDAQTAQAMERPHLGTATAKAGGWQEAPEAVGMFGAEGGTCCADAGEGGRADGSEAARPPEVSASGRRLEPEPRAPLSHGQGAERAGVRNQPAHLQ